MSSTQYGEACKQYLFILIRYSLAQPFGKTHHTHIGFGI